MGVSDHAVEIPLLSSFLYLLGETESELPHAGLPPVSSLKRRKEERAGLSRAPALAGPGVRARRDPLRGHYQVGSLTGAVHLSNDNAGVLRPAQRGQKPRVEQKGKCWLDPDFQYEYGLRKQGLSILLTLGVLSKRCQKSYHRDNWLVAAKRS